MGKVLALDIGGTKIAAAVVTESGMLVGRQQMATPRGGAAQLAIALETLIAPYRHLVDFIAVASTGIISGGRLTALNPANLGGLADFPLQDCIRSVADLPCVLLNDGQAAAWAEYQALSRDSDNEISVNNMMFVTVSTGVGGGIVLNKKLLVGHHGLAGHVGHTLADPHGLLCGCGRRGCVESVASGTAIGAETLGWKQPVTAVKVFELAQQGNIQAENIINRSATAIAQMLADMKMALDLEIVILGGSVGLAVGYLERVIGAQKTLPEIYRVPVQAAHHQQDSGLLGAALWARTSL
ncbi:N-acetylmannosamine kinase [Yersinia kristensenii]|uniref:N-acetylmannosamine kinase n=1 Tax=Yersinia kristensenii TaxID=28152 RepID=UPI0005E90C2E|nr:N-acetylmannosamine kinase [Yersinia kristensenii]MDA5474732.1 N-acetylmannosamine kinase [Yersinia kristensenii]MDA5477878.1 N-acetylmannosamine kinase [Yersinia kristensenii]MDA5506553.1 N-acetylmannosamine kinase [Yersinia kristensenii]NIK96848.1 N-acetylmannosamine kinase [Yersinia kristensenii]NIL08865.1 N-acetylmannosamine kinase [Yersinia kristensenii]